MFSLFSNLFFKTVISSAMNYRLERRALKRRQEADLRVAEIMMMLDGSNAIGQSQKCPPQREDLGRKVWGKGKGVEIQIV